MTYTQQHMKFMSSSNFETKSELKVESVTDIVGLHFLILRESVHVLELVGTPDEQRVLIWSLRF